MKNKLLLIRILSIIALGIALYLTWTSFQEGAVPAGCAQEGEGCNEVLKTRWSVFLGFPVAAGGALVYAALTLLAFLTTETSPPARWKQLALIAGIAAASGLWFTGLQVFLIKSICYYCMSVHACGIAIAAILFTIKPAEEIVTGKKKSKKTEIRYTSLIGMLLTGAAIVASFALVQIYVKPAPEPVIVDDEPPVPVPEPAPVTPVEPPPAQTSTGPALIPTDPAPGEQGEYTLAGGKVKLPRGRYPVIGSADASKIVGLLYDYTCPACRRVHPQISAEQKKQTDRAIVMIPMPLDAECNSAMSQTSYQHRNACQYAKIGLALWQINRDAFHQYDHYMFQTQFPPDLSDAMDYAGKLVGADVLQSTLARPDVTETLTRGIQIFHTQMQKKVLPSMLTRSGIYEGSPPEFGRLFE